jgi:gamma-glutamyltranspeptidase / glutathione hydrolase
MRLTLVVATLLASTMLLFVQGARAEEGSLFREAVRSEGGVVASESEAAAEAGREILDAGGNAVDAAVATTFAIGVAQPQSCGIGGGGFMVYRGADGETAALDFRETAPRTITGDAFQGDGIYTAYTGHKTVGVPGTVAGMQAALDRYGTMGLAETIAPAENLARDGFEVPESLSDSMGESQGRLELFPAAREQYLVDGKRPYEPGSTLVQEDLADTLATIADRGPDAFYEGGISEAIIDDMQDAGEYPGDEGLMTEQDLADYRAKWRDPVRGEYRDHEVVGMPAPSSGGIAVVQMLNILEGYDLREMGRSSADTLHTIAEAQKISFADRAEYVADPDFVEVPTGEILDKGYADERRDDIDPEEAKPSYDPGDFNPSGGGSGASENPDASTTHISVIDADGNAVALTCTIEQSFGSAVVAPGTGFLLNNELTDFDDPGAANEPEPGKRPRSSMSPTIVVRDGEPILVVGGSGGSQIIMGALHAVVNTVDFGLDPARAIDAERLDAQFPPELILEDGRVSATAEADLISRGHVVLSEGEYSDVPLVQAAGTDPETGERLAATDPRSGPQVSTGQGVSDSLPHTGGIPFAGCDSISGSAAPC